MRGGSQASIVSELDPTYIHKTLIAARSPGSFYNQSLVSLCIFYSARLEADLRATLHSIYPHARAPSDVQATSAGNVVTRPPAAVFVSRLSLRVPFAENSTLLFVRVPDGS
jgi:hypothetical protein